MQPIETPPEKKIKYKRRLPKICPECKKHIVELPSHMVRKHYWDPKKAAKVNCITNQRKLKPERKRKKKTELPALLLVVQLIYYP